MFTSVLRIEAQEEVLMPFPRTVSNQINMTAGHPQTLGNVHSDGQLIALSWNPITYCMDVCPLDVPKRWGKQLSRVPSNAARFPKSIRRQGADKVPTSLRWAGPNRSWDA